MIKAILFDLDNTLTDFMVIKHQSIDAAIKGMIDAGLKMDFDVVKEKIFAIYDIDGIESQDVFDKFLKEQLGKIDYKILAAGIVAYRKARTGELVLYPNVISTLIKLIKMNIRLAILSDAPKIQAWLRLCSLQLHNIVDVVVAYEDTGHRKPHPKPFQKVLERLELEPNEVIMIGDWAERDILGAKKLKMITAFAKYGDTFNTKDSGADYDINDISEIVNIVKKLNANT